MSDQVKFAVGDRVRFKSDHYAYRDQHGAPDEFVITKINNRCVYWDGVYGSAFMYRVEHVGGPW